MRLAGKPIHRGPLVDRPPHVATKRERPVDAELAGAVPIDTPWAPYPPQPGPMSAAMLARGHRVGRDGKTCRACKAVRPPGGWLPCSKAGR